MAEKSKVVQSFQEKMSPCFIERQELIRHAIHCYKFCIIPRFIVIRLSQLHKQRSSLLYHFIRNDKEFSRICQQGRIIAEVYIGIACEQVLFNNVVIQHIYTSVAAFYNVFYAAAHTVAKLHVFNK